MQTAPLTEKLGHEFRDPLLLTLALTHKSFANEQMRRGSSHSQDNERLEFLGDSILGLIISDLLYENFPEANEGKLSKVRSTLVRAETLSEVARSIDVGQFLLLGKGELSTGGHTKESILSSTFEALLGAVYLDGGLPAAFSVVEKHFSSLIQEAMSGAITRDYKTLLQELAQKNFKLSPNYRIQSESGPDHQKTFEVRVSVGTSECTGSGRNKKDAEQSAAEALYKQFLENTPSGSGPESVV